MFGVFVTFIRVCLWEVELYVSVLKRVSPVLGFH